MCLPASETGTTGQWSGSAARVADRSQGRKGRYQQVELILRGCVCFIATFACALGSICTPVHAVADPTVTVFPGMEVHEENSACMVGFVEARLRIAVTAGQCGGGSTVTDRNKEVLGTVVQAHRKPAEDAGAAGSTETADYQVIALAPNIAASDVLPTGRRLQSSPALRAALALPVCRLESSRGETCGRISAVGNGRFVIADMPADNSALGGPVYALTDDNRALVVGLLAGMGGTLPEAESWEAIMRQVYADGHAPERQPLFA